MDKDNIVNFPERENEEEHICDACTSALIHEISHDFEEIDDESVIMECLDGIYEGLENANGEAVVEAIYDMFWKAFDQGYKKHQKNMIQMLSGDLHMRSVEVDGEEQ